MSQDYFDYHCTGCGSTFTVSVPSAKGVEVNYRPTCPSCGRTKHIKEGTPSNPPAPIRESIQMGDGVSQMKLF